MQYATAMLSRSCELIPRLRSRLDKGLARCLASRRVGARDIVGRDCCDVVFCVQLDALDSLPVSA